APAHQGGGRGDGTRAGRRAGAVEGGRPGKEAHRGHRGGPGRDAGLLVSESGRRGRRVGEAVAPRRRAGGALGAGAPFARFWAAATAANLADGIAFTALPLVAAALTTDPLAVSGLAAARYLPWLLLGAAAGALVDRIRAMQAAGVVRSAVIIGLAALAAAGAASMWALYAVMFTVMACETVYDTAARAVLPGLVARDRLESANGRLESGRLVTEDFGGAPLAGLLFGVAAALPLAVNGLGYLLAVVLLAGLPATARRAPADPAAGAAAPRTAFRADVVEGLRFLFG